MKKIALYSLCALALLGCRKDNVEGPELADIFGEFEVFESLTADKSEVDFTAGETVAFSAKLSIRTDWELHIVGQTTGARKVISGRAKDITGEVATWNGTITFAPIFAEEVCSTYMTFLEYPDETLEGPDITISTVKPAAGVDLLISDFEADGQGFLPFTEPASDNYRLSGTYFQPDYGTPPGFVEVNPAEQNGYWRMTANNAGNIFICGFSLGGANVQGNTDGAAYYGMGTNNPDNVYFNAFVHGFGDGNTRMVINFQEDDNLDGTYDRFTEGSWGKEILVDWTGWKLVSFPLSETLLSTSGGFGNIDGTGQKDLDRILNMECLLLAAEGSAGLTGFCMDYANITLFTPFEP